MPDEMPTAEAPYFVMIDYGAYEGWGFVGTAKTLQELASVYERGTLTGGACSPLLVGRLVALRFVDSPDVGVRP
jgi:hypothetical protein